MLTRGWLLGELALHLERFGYACLSVAKRLEAKAINRQMRETDLPGDGPGHIEQGSTSGSPATGESGGRRGITRIVFRVKTPNAKALRATQNPQNRLTI